MNNCELAGQCNFRRSRNRFLVVSFALLAVATSAYGADDRPNILFIMSDDHTTQAIGAYGSRLEKLNPTPNIDALHSGEHCPG